MRKYALPLVAAILLLSLPSIAQNITEVTQGAPGKKGSWPVRGSVASGAAVTTEAPVKVAGQDGTNVRTVLTDAAGRLITAGYGGYGQVFTPGVPTRCNMAAATSCPLTAFAAAGSCVQLFCSVDSFFRFGAGAQVAVATDTSVSAKTIQRFCMTAAQESAAFYSASAGYCELSVVPLAP